MKKLTEWHYLLEGSIEMHAHSSPSVFPRRQNDWELLKDVKEARMDGIVLKSHESSTVDRAELLRLKYPDLNICGGLVCNLFTGGLKYEPVDMALRMGAKIIWMPTLSAVQHKKYFSKNIKENIFNSEKKVSDLTDGLTVTTFNNEIKDEVKEILALIAENNAILATGHLNHSEVILLVEEAKSLGVNKILIQHADLGIAPIPLDEQMYLANQGCFIEKCYLACGPDFNDISVKNMTETISKIGDDNCVLVTDYGQQHNIPVIEALQKFITQLLCNDVGEESIKKMINKNPKKLLNIESGN